MRLHRPPRLALVLAVLAGCGDDGGQAIDADVERDAATDARPDAPVVDATLDAARIDGGVDAMPVPVLNGCTAATAIDRTAPGAARAIIFASFLYDPPCMTVRVGQTVTWSGDFSLHPLAAGAIVNDVPMAQPGNPIPSTTTGNLATVTFAAAGDVGYYCASHFTSGMAGAIYVVP